VVPSGCYLKVANEVSLNWVLWVISELVAGTLLLNRFLTKLKRSDLPL
jgi:hypothetical protein